MTTSPASFVRISALRPGGHGSGRAALAGLLTLALLVGLSSSADPRPLETHEIFVAQTAREMLERHDWVLPTFNGEPRLTKPPLMYWLVMAGMELLGREGRVPEWLARFPSAVSGAVLVLATCLLGSIVYDRRIGMLAGLFLCGMAGFWEYANTARPEMLYAACCSLATLGWVRAMFVPAGPSTRSWWLWWIFGWIGASLAVLAKGPQMPALIGAGLLLHMGLGRVSLRRTHDDAEGHAPSAAAGRTGRLVAAWLAGIVTFALISTPWFLAVLARSDAASQVWSEQLLDKEGGLRNPEQTLLYWLTPHYLWGVPAIMLPWAVLLPFGLAVSWQRRAAAWQSPATPLRQPQPIPLSRGRALFWSGLIPVLLMQLTFHRRDYYMLPILPMWSVLCAAGVMDFTARLRVPGTGAAGALLRLPASLGLLVAGAWIVLGGARWLWSGERWARQEFVERVAQAVAERGRLYTCGVEPSHYLYEIGEPVEAVSLDRDGAAEFPFDASASPVWVVMTKKHWDRVQELARGRWRGEVLDEWAGDDGRGEVFGRFIAMDPDGSSPQS